MGLLPVAAAVDRVPTVRPGPTPWKAVPVRPREA